MGLTRLTIVVAVLHAAALAVLVAVAGVWTAGPVVTIAGASIAVAMEAAHQRRDDQVPQLPLETLTGLGLLALVCASALGHASGATAGVAAALIALGIGLRVAAMRSLGRAFATRPLAGDPLVTTGLYRRLRHPSEVGLIALAAGFTVIAAHPLAVAIFVALVAITFLRTRREDAALAHRRP